jgi:signal peptide peptidase SppA
MANELIPGWTADAEVRYEQGATHLPPIATLDLGPGQIPYLQHWFGLWSIYEPAAQQLLYAVQNLDLSAHLAALQERRSEESRTPYTVDQNGIATFQIVGTMLKQQSSFGGGTSTVQLRRDLRQALNDPQVRGLMLVIDSPGGTVAGTYDLASEVASARKPIHTYIEDLGASAAYVVASQSQRISANSNAVVGSIGTFLMVHDYSKLYAERGVKVHVVKAGEFKGTGAQGTEITAEQLAELQRHIDEMNGLFTSAVERGRKLTREQVTALADGRVHIGSSAKTLGLIDAVETLDQAYSNLVSAVMKGRTMSTNQETKSETTVPPAPKAATLTELKAACPGATPAFVLEQLEAQATVNQAAAAWMKLQQEEIGKLKQQNEELAKQQAEPPAKKPGNKPIESTGKVPEGNQSVGDAIAEWDEAIATHMKAGKSKAEAARQVVKENPELRAAYVEAYNAKVQAEKRAS